MLADFSYWFTWFPGSVLATLGVLGLAWKAIEQRVEEKRVLSELKVALPKIQAEFSNNGGASMKDRVDSLHHKVDNLAYDSRKWQRTHARDDDTRFGKVEASLERIEDKLDP